MKTLKLFMLTMSFLIVISCSDKNEKQINDEIISVKLADVVTQEISIPIHTSGRLKSKKEAKLSFKNGGIVSKIFVTEGEAVKKGEVLSKLNLEEIESQFNQAKINYEKSLRDFNRVQSLYKDSVVTLEQFQNSQSALDAASSTLNIAKFNLNYSTITAPFDCKIYKKLVEENEIVSPGMPIFFVGAENEGWQIVCGITDVDVTKIKNGDKAKINFDSFPENYAGQISKIGASANPMSGLYEVELTLNNSKDKFVSGLIASVDILTSLKNTYEKIPIQSLVEANRNEGYVFIPNENNSKAKKVEVTIHEILGNTVLVNFPEKKISKVITEGAEYLRDGVSITVLK